MDNFSPIVLALVGLVPAFLVYLTTSQRNKDDANKTDSDKRVASAEVKKIEAEAVVAAAEIYKDIVDTLQEENNKLHCESLELRVLDDTRRKEILDLKAEFYAKENDNDRCRQELKDALAIIAKDVYKRRKKPSTGNALLDGEITDCK